jgi:hypothetical protein
MNQSGEMEGRNFDRTKTFGLLRLKNVLTNLLFLVLFSFTANAQFIKIDIDVPAKTGVSDLETSDQSRNQDLNKNAQELDGTYGLTLSSAENLRILATLKHSDYLINASGIGVRLTATLAYKNDGKSRPVKANASDKVEFPISDSGLLIDNMKDNPQELTAYLMVFTSIEKPKISGSIYFGEILLTIEYN